MEPEGSLPCSQEPSTGPYLDALKDSWTAPKKEIAFIAVSSGNLNLQKWKWSNMIRALEIALYYELWLLRQTCQ
jgi:hypothetical protein